MGRKREVHEPNVALAGADEAVADAARIEELRAPQAPPMVRVPLESLLDAIDSLDASQLREVQRRVEKRLAEIGARR